MWIVIKYKTRELNILKKAMKELLNENPEYFLPQIKYSKIINKKFKFLNKTLLEGYLIFFHNKFKDEKILNSIKYTRGVSQLLNGFKNSQKEIIKFINRCKSFEDNKGFIKQDFFNRDNFVKAKFISGPFTNFVFDILSKKSDKTEIILGKYKATLSKKSNHLYFPV